MRPRPRSPGGYERRSTPHLSVRQRSPLRNSFCPSRRHCLHWGPVSRAIRRLLDAPPLAGAAAVVRLRGDVADGRDLQAGGLERADRRLAPGARALHEDLDLLQALLDALAGRRVSRHLGGERRRLARALETGAAGGLPGDDVARLVGERDDRVVERRLDVRLADGDVLLGAPPASLRALRCGAQLLLPCLLLPGHLHALGALTRTRVGLGVLAADGQAATVAETAVAADLHQALDVLRALAAQIALDRQIAVDGVAQLADLVLGEVANVGVRGHTDLGQQLVGRRAADPVDVGQPDLNALVERDVDA